MCFSNLHFIHLALCCDSHPLCSLRPYEFFLSKIKKGHNLWYLMTIQFYKACIFVSLRLCLFGRKGREEKRKEKRRERKKERGKKIFLLCVFRWRGEEKGERRNKKIIIKLYFIIGLVNYKFIINYEDIKVISQKIKIL